MNSDEQIAKILELEQALRDKPAKFTVQTLMPVGLVLTIIGFSFAFGVNFQAANQTKTDLEGNEVKDKGITTRLAHWKKHPSEELWLVQHNELLADKEGKIQEFDKNILFPPPNMEELLKK